MGALKIDPLEIGRRLRINQRFGSLLLREREATGLSRADIANQFRLNQVDLSQWELGRASPPAKVFYAIIKFYGLAALHRAAALDFEIQMEKYYLVTAQKRSSTITKGLSVILDHHLAA